jgi:hypothetical protein
MRPGCRTPLNNRSSEPAGLSIRSGWVLGLSVGFALREPLLTVSPWFEARLGFLRETTVGAVGGGYQEAQTERVSGRVGVHLEVIPLGSTACRAEHASAKARHCLVSFGKVLHPQVEVNLLRG